MRLQKKEEKAIIRNIKEDISFDFMLKFDLKHFRLSVTKLSQEDFARKLGVAVGTVGKIEANHQKISDKMLQRIADAFGIDMEQYKSYNAKNQQQVTEAELEYGNVWKDKYYELLEENKELHKKLLGCIEEKDKLKEDYKSSPGKVDKPVS